MENKSIGPGEITVWAAGGLAFIFSFLPWFSFGGFTANSWGSNDSDVFPIATYAFLWIIGAACILAIKKFGNVSFGMEKYVGFSGTALQNAFPVFALFLSLGWLVATTDGRGIAMWFAPLLAAAAIAGNVLIARGIGFPTSTGQGAPSWPAQPGAPQQWAAPPAAAPGVPAPPAPPAAQPAPPAPQPAPPAPPAPAAPPAPPATPPTPQPAPPAAPPTPQPAPPVPPTPAAPPAPPADAPPADETGLDTATTRLSDLPAPQAPAEDPPPQPPPPPAPPA